MKVERISSLCLTVKKTDERALDPQKQETR